MRMMTRLKFAVFAVFVLKAAFMSNTSYASPEHANSDYRSEKLALVSEQLEYLMSRINEINEQHGSDNHNVRLNHTAIISDLKKVKTGIDEFISLQLDSVRVHEPVTGEYACER